MIKLFYILLIIIFIIYILFVRDNRINTSKHIIKKYNNILSEETLELFKYYNFKTNGIYGDILVDVFEYNINELEITKIYKKKISEFIKNDNKNGKKQQIVLYLNDYHEFNKSLNLIKKDLSKFYKIDDNIKFKIRISKTPWIYGAHFDCLDSKILQLLNQRKVATLNYNISDNDYSEIKYLSIKNLKKKYRNVNETVLNPGDLIEIPIGLTHSIEGNAISVDENVSILLSFSLDEKHSLKCNNIFDKYFKRRATELDNGII